MPAGIIFKRNGHLLDDDVPLAKPIVLDLMCSDLEGENLVCRAIVSRPPEGAKKVVNLYVVDGKLKIEYEG